LPERSAVLKSAWIKRYEKLAKKYKWIDHTADFGLHIFGKDPGDLFANAALALFDLVAEMRRVTGENQKKITVTGSDWPDLMVNWLRELLYLWTGSELLVKAATIQKISAHEIHATLYYDRYDSDRHVIKTEIKAVTYHQIQVTSSRQGWEAQVIFDV
jgi:SHS2 domain-containing protein